MIKHQHFNVEMLRWLRQSKGLSIEEFAGKIGRTGRTVINWEQQKTSPTMRDLERICTTFDVRLSSFLIDTATANSGR